MAVRLNDAEIQALINEKKELPVGFERRMQLKDKRGHRERDLPIDGENGSQFRLILRQSTYNALDFSVIVAYEPPDSTQSFRLIRCNGRSHEHTNPLESDKFYDFHVHRATERYQDSGYREDAFAVITSEYSDLLSALRFALQACSFQSAEGTTASLFNGGSL